MEYFDFFLEVMQKEATEYNLELNIYKSFTSSLTATFLESFDVAYNRCAFMYRYATSNTYFVKGCIEKFLLEYPHAKARWALLPSLNLCSLSCGPGLDSLAFILAILESEGSSVKFNNLKIISKYTAWRNTVRFVSEVIQQEKLTPFSSLNNQLNFQNVDVIQGNVLEIFSDDMKAALENSDVILMVKTLNLQTVMEHDKNKDVLRKLIELISCLKCGATVIFIDTKPSMALMTSALQRSPGLYLHQSYFRLPSAEIPDTFSDDLRSMFGVLPVVSSRGAFFVWQKCKNFNELELSSKPGTTDFPWPFNVTQSSTKKVISLDKKAVKLSCPKSFHQHRIPDGVFRTLEPAQISKNVKVSKHSIDQQPSVNCTDTLKTFEKSTKNVSNQTQQDYSHITKKETDNIQNCSSLPMSFNGSHNTSSKGPNCYIHAGLNSSKSEIVIDESETAPNNLNPNSTGKKLINKSRSHNKNSDINVYTSKPKLSSVENKLLQTDPVVETKSESSYNAIRLLIERIEKLVVSIEQVQQSSSESQRAFASCNHSEVDNMSCHVAGETAYKKQSPNFKCFYSSNGSCLNKCCVVPQCVTHHCCQHYGEHDTPRCCHSPCKQSYITNNISASVPSIVIPLQNVKSDALTHIVSSLTTGIHCDRRGPK